MSPPVKKIFISGAGVISDFLPYVKSLTAKANPRMCLLPTAVGDNPYIINRWYERCAELDIKGFVQRMFISSYEQHQTFEEVLLSMDAIVVTGGNTLNMIAIWKAQGIDEILRTAWEQGIILSGGSAGSLCWFEQGTTDSRPQRVTTVNCLGFLKGSHCPHYNSESTRRPLYHSFIKSGEFRPGYACDDRAGILFNDQQVERVISFDDTSNAYYVYLDDDTVIEKKLEKTLLSSETLF